MSTFLVGYYGFIDLLRVVLLYSAVALTGVFAVDWLVRTRRINPFGPVARFFRASVDPLLAPVERTIVRAGGMPTSAPWWALVFVVVGGILLVSLLGLIGQQIAAFSNASANGPAGVFVMLASATLGVLKIALLVRVISSWVRVSPYSPWVRWSFGLTEWLLGPLRRLIPPIGGMIDISPIIAYYVLSWGGGLLVSAIAGALLGAGR